MRRPAGDSGNVLARLHLRSEAGAAAFGLQPPLPTSTIGVPSDCRILHKLAFEAKQVRFRENASGLSCPEPRIIVPAWHGA